MLQYKMRKISTTQTLAEAEFVNVSPAALTITLIVNALTGLRLGIINTLE